MSEHERRISLTHIFRTIETFLRLQLAAQRRTHRKTIRTPNLPKLQIANTISFTSNPFSVTIHSHSPSTASGYEHTTPSKQNNNATILPRPFTRTSSSRSGQYRHQVHATLGSCGNRTWVHCHSGCPSPQVHQHSTRVEVTSCINMYPPHFLGNPLKELNCTAMGPLAIATRVYFAGNTVDGICLGRL
ncbi:hypothetical protein BaRGS_00007483 [Batillaria attramentaria]|uniref:Uncharacterized protein n=1 Tax=Batillaria attramentaria TaxID=370345 RepID=A0ABD0LQ43_9CAEN